jgi:hypothetical protein
MNYICFTRHFIDPNWTFHKRILAFRRVLDHKGQTIAKELEECLVEWRMLTIVHEGLKDVDNSIIKIRKIVEYVKSSPKNWLSLSLVSKEKALSVMLH